MNRLRFLFRFLPFRTKIKLGVIASLIFGLALYLAVNAIRIVHIYFIKKVQSVIIFIHPSFDSYIGYGISIIICIFILGILGMVVDKTETKIALLIKKIPMMGNVWTFFEMLFHTARNHLLVVRINDYPYKGVKSLALIMGKTFEEENGVRTYFPCVGFSSSPNPFTGQLIFPEREKLALTTMSFEQYMSTIVTLGASGIAIRDDEKPEETKKKGIILHLDQSILDRYYRE